MELSALLAMALGCLVATSQPAAAISAGDADIMYEGFNAAFLKTSGNDTFYKSALNATWADANWAADLNYLGTEDAYERTGDPAIKTLINSLLESWIVATPLPWSVNGFNDDVGWYTLALSRAYRITHNPDFLKWAEYGFNFAYDRGWDTEHNGGGIWETQPANTSSPVKDALSTNSLGKVSCILYQSTLNQTYLDKCKQIYAWTRSNIYNPSTGEVYFGVDPSGNINKSPAAYNQGTFVDFAHLVYLVTGNTSYHADSVKAIDFGRNNITTNGIFTVSDQSLNTWGDEMARGVGHVSADTRLWDTYYTWMVQNADAIMTNRRTDLNITWNAWNETTEHDEGQMANHFVSAMAWLQLTPATKPDERAGLHTILNNATGMAIDTNGTYGDGNAITLAGQSNVNLCQRWQLSQNSDGTFNIVNTAVWNALDSASNATNAGVIQHYPTRLTSQRWSIDQQTDGTYKITNAASKLVLDAGSGAGNGTALVQNTWTGSASQKWTLN